jgi:hypothetical protein
VGVVVAVGDFVGEAVGVVVGVEVGVGVGVALPQLLTNTPVSRINIRVKYIIFFISNSLLKKLIYGM